MIKYGKHIIIALTALFVICGAFLLRSPDPGIRTERTPEPIRSSFVGESKQELLNGESININTASAAELERIPGIGPVLSQRIVEYRLQNGDFTSLRELVNVKGIGENSLAKMLPYMRIN